MNLERPSFLVKALLLVAIWSANCDGKVLVSKFSILEDTGYATNCGKTNFTLSWTPKVLSALRSVDLALIYQFPYVLDGGAYNLTLTEYGQEEPFLTYANPFTCDDIKDLHAPCPLPKGLPINIKKHIDNTKFLMSFPGRYTLRAEVKNKEGQQMICALLDLTINNYN